MTNNYSNNPSSPNSADIVDHIEKRISIEIEQLQRDIKRIEPAGADWCKFGDLFIDTAVQQYYEALVNTLKSAKRKGVVYFKGQFLLKGMHDDVVVKIVSKEKEVASKEANSFAGTTTVTEPKSKAQSLHTPKHDPPKSFNSSAASRNKLQAEKNSPESNISNTNKKNKSTDQKFPKYQTYKRSPTQSSMQKSSSFTKNRNYSGNSNSPSLQLIMEQEQQVQMVITKEEVSSKDIDEDEMLSPSVEFKKYSERREAPTEKIEDTNSHTNIIKSTTPSNSSKIGIIGRKLDSFLLDPTSPTKQSEEGGDNESVVSFATAPVFSMNKSPNAINISKAQNRDVVHFSVAGTTFNPGSSTSESHTERLEREMQQLVEDIRRIEPQNEGFCKFGMLFDDPQVEQYYEALVGTLKAARRKGIISFKGQILLKGMHDNVQISIVE